MASFGTRHLADNPTTYQPVRTNNFEMVVDFSKINLNKPGSTSALTSSIDASTAKDVINFSVISFDVPNFEQDEIEIKRGNSKVYFAGTPTWNPGSLKINDFVGADGKSILLAWQACSYNVNDDTIPSSDKYKVDATVLEYLPDNTLVRYWDLKGCWIKGLSEDGWDNESAGKKTLTASIRFDRAIPHLPD